MKKSKLALSIAIMLLQFAFATALRAGNSTDTDSNNISKACFYSARQELNDMLSGKTPLSYERAIYLIENAYWKNEIDYSAFQTELDFHTQNIRRIIEANRNEAAQNFKVTLLESIEKKKEKYEKALTNWAIFSYISDTTLFHLDDKYYYHLPFLYANTDPLGTLNWGHTQVFSLLNNHIRQGNCFALVSLFKIFSERLNSDANICTAPGHVYIRHADNKGLCHNVELATRSFPGTGTIETLTYTTKEATVNNISLRELDLKQSVALCFVYLAKGYEYKLGIKDDGFIFQCGELTLEYDSLNLNAMLLKAEVLEDRIITKNKTVAQLQNDNEFKQYEKLILHLYQLGYLEMPLEMKNYVIAKLRNDSSAIIVKDHTPQPFAHLGVKDDNYATLSWGLFEEVHEIKAFEQYQHTVFDTKKKKIKKFVSLDTTYNNYPIDMVVFAWSIDPLTHKYPNISPYVAFADNPIFFVDKDGQEVFIHGEDAQKAVAALGKVTHLKLKYDAESGQLQAMGKPRSKLDKELLKAINDDGIKVNLNTTRENSFKSKDGGTVPVTIGGYDGSTKSTETVDGKSKEIVTTAQYINMTHSEKAEKAGVSNQGSDVFHETIESYYGAQNDPGGSYDKTKFQDAHNKALSADPKAQNLFLNLNSKTGQAGLINPSNEKSVDLRPMTPDEQKAAEKK